LENLKIIKMKENKDLNKIRHFKGSVSDFKNYFDQRAGENTNAFNTPDYQGFNNVHPTRGKTESPHWNDVNESKNDTGLIIKGRTRADNQKIDDILDDLGLLGEWDAREGHFFLPEEEDMFDELENMIQKEFNKRNVNAYFEGVFESLNEKSINKIQKDWAKITAEMKDTVSAWKSAEGKDKDNLLKKLKDLTSKKKKLESELNTAVGLKDVDIELVDEASFGAPSNGDYSDEMSFGQLEKCIDYSTMIRQRIQQGTSLDPWMHSQIAVAENELNSVWDAIDGDDGVVESTSNKIPSFKNYESLNENQRPYIKNEKVTGKVYHVAGEPIKTLNNRPMWFALEKEHSDDGWYANMIENGGAYQYSAKISGKICNVFEDRIQKLFQDNGLDVGEWETEIIGNPSAEEVMKLEGTKLLIKNGFAGAIYVDYDPRDFQEDLDALIIFNAKKSVKGWKLEKYQ